MKCHPLQEKDAQGYRSWQQSSHGNRVVMATENTVADFISVGAFAELENTSLRRGCSLPSVSDTSTYAQ